ncbi:MFS transporter AraJ [Klebsiella quasipneumoniae]|uniref:MFS transporter AraJ n=1 Tax=Klebsiella quasipneumoniae TaxID=1463165 RepID=UPI000C7C9146|nr:MFS transporter AraJ [Klebsiella quasipneumoniae]MBR7421144.1 MFS transporter AraJ [Klebsiella quasipneumoniae]MBR7457448.1 MFS transporter AraJ [Klebsiella quasipneumoniae]PLF84832.1 MFS transporter AraJ [Klebsiella quasipneumoniae]PLJ75658.1 MFS transporter AraJ [Klebsiella quasipneumoniae]
MKKTIFSLALGTFGLGMAEFGIMGVLPDMARDVGISIPAAGNMIAWYAFGVVIGAPIMALLSSRFSLKSVMLFLAALCILGNTLFTFSSSYAMLALGRLVSGFPHGAFFGVGAIILSKIAPPGRVTAAVANLVGVPGGTWLGHHFSWRYTFALIAVFNVAVFMAIFCWVPTLYDRATTRLREQFRFLTSPAPWLIFAATMFGNAGVFAWFSYIKPFMLNVSGFAESRMMLIMMLAGLGMVVGNLFSGKISGRYSPLRIAAITDGAIAVTLLLIFAFGEHKIASLTLAFFCCAGLFALSAPLQILLLQNAKGGEMLGAAGGQIAFNLGSAIGAFCGGMMIAQGFGWNSVALPAATLSFLAMSALLIYGRHQRRQAC